MGPGMSWYLVEFRFEGYKYIWDNKKKAFYNEISKKEFSKPPIGSSWDLNCFISGWRLEKDKEE